MLREIASVPHHWALTMEAEKSKPAVDDRIWITSRVRMVSEKRAKRNNLLSLVLLTYYSLFAVMMSVFSGYYQGHYGNFESISVAASVAVLVASLVVSGFGFERTAWLHRDCYLSLQKLHGKEISEEEKNLQYNDILALYPNHSDSDYYDFLVQHTFLDDKKVWNNSAVISYTKFMLFSYAGRRTLLAAFVLLAVGVPALFFAIPLLPGKP